MTGSKFKPTNESNRIGIPNSWKRSEALFFPTTRFTISDCKIFSTKDIIDHYIADTLYYNSTDEEYSTTAQTGTGWILLKSAMPGNIITVVDDKTSGVLNNNNGAYLVYNKVLTENPGLGLKKIVTTPFDDLIWFNESGVSQSITSSTFALTFDQKYNNCTTLTDITLSVTTPVDSSEHYSHLCEAIYKITNNGTDTCTITLPNDTTNGTNFYGSNTMTLSATKSCEIVLTYWGNGKYSFNGGVS